MKDKQNVIDQVIKIVEEIGREIADISFTISEKGNACNIVTSSDIYVQNALNQRLCALVDGSTLVGEEGWEKSDSDYYWIVDPIDGTMNFSRGIDEYAISVALCKGDETILGVVHSPVKKLTYYAEKGKGAFLNGKPISVSNNGFESGILCTAASLYDKRFAGICFEIIEEIYMRSNDIRRFGTCALELCYLADGKCDLYFEIRVFSWDCTAALLILSEAGGVACSVAPYSFTKNQKPFPVLAANNKENLEKIKKVVQKYINKELY